jgi:hypothetical protein
MESSNISMNSQKIFIETSFLVFRNTEQGSDKHVVNIATTTIRTSTSN